MPVDRLLPVLPKPESEWEKAIDEQFSQWSQDVADFSKTPFVFNVVTKTAAYTVNKRQSVVLCNATSGAFTVTLPPAKSMRNRGVYIKKIDSSGNAITVDADGSEKIDGATTQSLATQHKMILIVSNGTAWYILSDNR